MERNTKIIIWSSVSVIAVIATVLIYNKWRDKHPKNGKDGKNPNEEADQNLKDVVASNETTTQTKIASDVLPFTLDRGNNRGGSEGLRVAQMQLMLNYAYGSHLTVDGKFGAQARDVLSKEFPVLYPCNKFTQLLGTSICTVSKKLWDAIQSDVIKKGGGSIAGFNTYLRASSEFANLARYKYKL